MVTHSPSAISANVSTERKLPPITQMAIATLILIVIGGVYLASHLPTTPPLAPAIALLAVSGVVLAANVVILSRIQDFAWTHFFLVGRWALLAYLVIAGMLEYVFVVDGTRGGPLIVLTLMLAVYAVDIPLLLAFSVARYQQASAGL